MERHFLCTACGQCCHGWLPLTLADAWRQAHRFPLALSWMPVTKGARNYALGLRLGAAVKRRKPPALAAVITPIAYLPPTFPCPELEADGRCGIHDAKPLRCRAMPFYAYREEQDQADLLTPRPGWACDISPSAPLVYRDRRIVERDAFDRERAALLEQAPVMRLYAEYILKYQPWVAEGLEAALHRPNGQVVTGLSGFFTATRLAEAPALAARQRPVLRDMAVRTADQPALVEYHRHYSAWAEEMAYLAQAPTED